MSGPALVVVLLGVAFAVAVLAVLLWQWFPRPMSTDPSLADDPARGPTAPDPPGSRPAGPGAEGMAVGEDGGDIGSAPPRADTGLEPDQFTPPGGPRE